MSPSRRRTGWANMLPSLSVAYDATYAASLSDSRQTLIITEVEIFTDERYPAMRTYRSGYVGFLPTKTTPLGRVKRKTFSTTHADSGGGATAVVRHAAAARNSEPAPPPAPRAPRPTPARPPRRPSAAQATQSSRARHSCILSVRFSSQTSALCFEKLPDVIA
ncbi:hypothetical protein EVAR_4938_1 [Eumeta japonica]|uniref:Uncharacterized protein n=1 Tax=Eumeta variegata TaxID=151549 RepID=A0A4C1UYY5_EUMVA|nr:hypothetical protein EVAR_4938_1 [Eumeta japonica]